LASAFVALRLSRTELGLSTLVMAGELRVDVAELPGELIAWPDIVGYDGRFFYRLALDPFTDDPEAFGIPLDHPGYRQRRILYPLLAHILNGFTGTSVLVWLVLLNAFAIGLMTGFVAIICRYYGKSTWWSPVVGLSAPMYIGLTRDLSEPMALALAVGGALAVIRSRWWWAAVLFALAALTRETTLVVPAGVGIWAIWHWVRWKKSSLAPALAMLIPLSAFIAWELWLRKNWGTSAIEADIGRQLGFPWLEVIQGLYQPETQTILQAEVLYQWLWRIERFMLVGLLIATALLLRKSHLHPGLKVSWLLAVLLAGAPSFGWAWDAQFIRAAAEAVILMQLVLLATPGTRARIVLEISALLTVLIVGSS
jgi:hypothetical protein